MGCRWSSMRLWNMNIYFGIIEKLIIKLKWQERSALFVKQIATGVEKFSKGDCVPKTFSMQDSPFTM